MTKSREELIRLLRVGTTIVTFIKSNGEERTMYASLEEKYVGADAVDVQTDDNIPVWDTEKNDWRSFNYSSVISYVAI